MKNFCYINHFLFYFNPASNLLMVFPWKKDKIE